MKKILVSSILLSMFSVHSEQMMGSNFLEIAITKMSYERPVIDSVKSGELIFTSVKMSRSNLSFGLMNKNNSFDSEITFSGKSLGFNSNHMNMDFDLGEDTSFKNIEKMSTDKTFVIINPSFFSFYGKSFLFEMESNALQIMNYSIYCNANNPDIDMATGEGIENGCMTEMIISEEHPDKKTKLMFELKNEIGDNLKFEAELGEISITDGTLIKFNAKDSQITVSNYDVKTSEITASCSKDQDDKTFIVEKLVKECENSLEVVDTKILMVDKIKDTKFFIRSELLKVADEQLSLITSAIQFIDKVSSVTTTGLTLKCKKSNDVEVNDLQGVIGECLDSGEIYIGKVITTDEKKLWWRYDSVLEGDYNPEVGSKKKDISAKDVWIKLDKNKLKLNANVYGSFLGIRTKFKVSLRADVIQYKDRKQLIIDVSQIEVPVGWFKLKWKKFFMNILKKTMVGDSIDVIGDKIILSL